MIDKFFYSIVLLLLLFFKPERVEEFSSGFNFILSIVYFLLVVFFLARKRKESENWLRFDVVFLIGFSIVHFEIPFLASIGIDAILSDFVWPNQRVVNFATWMSVFSITLWMLGSSFLRNKAESYKQDSAVINVNINFYLYDFILFIAFILFLLTVGPSLYRGEYSGSQVWGVGASYAYFITRVMINLRIIYFIIDLKGKAGFKVIVRELFKNKLFFTIVITYISIFLLLGQRGNILQVALVAAGAFTLFIKPISLLRLTFFLFVGAFLFTLISLGRGADSSSFEDNNIFSRGYSSYQEKEFKSVTSELAGSVKIQYRALDNVPEKHPYLYGLTYFSNLVVVVPFIGTQVLNVLNVSEMYRGTTNFFTIMHRGFNPDSGDGSEILSDIYVNFGLYGVFVIMFLFGMLSSKLHFKAMSKDLLYVLIYLVMLYMALTINRGMLLSPVKEIAYILFIHIIFYKINLGRSK